MAGPPLPGPPGKWHQCWWWEGPLAALSASVAGVATMSPRGGLVLASASGHTEPGTSAKHPRCPQLHRPGSWPPGAVPKCYREWGRTGSHQVVPHVALVLLLRGVTSAGPGTVRHPRDKCWVCGGHPGPPPGAIMATAATSASAWRRGPVASLVEEPAGG